MQRSSAFTLVELLVAMVIFASVIAGGLACLRMGLNQIDNARSETRASQVMQSEIERLRSLAWDNFTALDGSDQEVSLSSEFNDSAYGSFKMKRSITGSGTSRKITLIIEWEDLRGASHSKSYATQYTRGGLYDYIQ
ncbi:MAG TPA: type II secretion system protein [Opitutales bacterium]|nr:type II secretion system protein [Opitutales bacterium]